MSIRKLARERARIATGAPRMNELARTGLFVAGAAALIAAAGWIRPDATRAEIFSDHRRSVLPQLPKC